LSQSYRLSMGVFYGIFWFKLYSSSHFRWCNKSIEETKRKIVKCTVRQIKNVISVYQMNSNYLGSMLRSRKLSNRHRIQQRVYIYTIISTAIIRELGGSWFFIDGTRAIKPNVTVAIDPILPSNPVYWKKIARPNKASIKIGMKIVANAFPGCLYKGTTICVYW